MLLYPVDALLLAEAKKKHGFFYILDIYRELLVFHPEGLRIFQVERSKLNVSKKDHLHDTFEFAFSLISKALEKNS